MEIEKSKIFTEIETVFSELIKDCETLTDTCVGSEETSSLAKDVIGLKLKAELGKKLLSDLRKDI